MREKKLPLRLARCDSTHPRARVPPRERRSHRIFHFLLAPSAALRSGSWRRPSEPPRRTSIADEVAGVGQEGRDTAAGVKPGRRRRGGGQAAAASVAQRWGKGRGGPVVELQRPVRDGGC
jgi:hypothetical protein